MRSRSCSHLLHGLLTVSLLAGCARQLPGTALPRDAAIDSPSSDGRPKDQPSVDLPLHDGPPADQHVVDGGGDRGVPDGSRDSGPLPLDASVVLPLKFRSAACSVDTWCWVEPLPHGNTLYDVRGGGGEWVTVGEQGVVMRRGGAGTGWQVLDTPTNARLRAVWGTTASDFWAAGEGGALLHVTGAGVALVPSPGGSRNLWALWGSAANDIWAVGDNGWIQHFDGQGWRAVASPTFNDLRALWGASATSVYAAGGAGTLLHFDGTSWKKVPAPDPSLAFVALTGLGPKAYALTSSGAVVATDGSSANADTALPTGMLYSDIHAAGAQLFAVGRNFAAGETTLWRKVSAGAWSSAGTVAGWVFALDGPSPTELGVVGLQGFVGHFDGSTFAKEAGGSFQSGTQQTALAVEPSGMALIAGLQAGTPAVRQGAKTSWSSVAAPPSSISALWASAPDQAWAATLNGVWRFDGAIWTDADANFSQAVTGIFGLPNGTLVAVGNNSTGPGFVRYQDASGSWTDATLPATPTVKRLQAVWGVGTQDLFVVGSTGSGIIAPLAMRLDSTGWSVMTLAAGVSNGVSCVWGLTSSEVWACHSKGLLHYDGASWVDEKLPSAGAINAVWGRSKTELYAVGAAGRAFQRTQNGWVAVETGVSADLAGIGGGSSGPIYAIIRNGGIIALGLAP